MASSNEKELAICNKDQLIIDLSKTGDGNSEFVYTNCNFREKVYFIPLLVGVLSA